MNSNAAPMRYATKACLRRPMRESGVSLRLPQSPAHSLVSSKRHGDPARAIALIQAGIAASFVLKARDSRARGAACRARHVVPRGNRTNEKHAESVQEIRVRPVQDCAYVTISRVHSGRHFWGGFSPGVAIRV
jgi:hypothetical protein